MSKDYSEILNIYPEFITKEQFYKICHVSKKTALYYLESGLIPCVDSGKKTYRFTIATKDVVTFLEKRDKFPEQYKAKTGWYQGKGKRVLPYIIVQISQNKKVKTQLTRWLKEYPDLIKATEVSKITGYSLKTVFNWCAAGKLHYFRIRRAMLIPKLSLIDFMMSDNFRGIKVVKEEYAGFREVFFALSKEEVSD